MSWTITEKSQSFRFQSHWRDGYKRYINALSRVRKSEGGTLQPDGTIILTDKNDPDWKISVYTPVTPNFCAYYSEVIWLAIKLLGLGLMIDGMVVLLFNFFSPINFGVGYNLWYSCLCLITIIAGWLGWCGLAGFIFIPILVYILDKWDSYLDIKKSKKVKRPKNELIAVINMWYKSRKEQICPMIDFKVHDDSSTQPKAV